MNRTAVTLAIAGSLAAAISFAAQAAPGPVTQPDNTEKCYGVALKGHNDCASGTHQCGAMSTKSYSKADFKYVATGTCVKMHPHGHMGSLQPA